MESAAKEWKVSEQVTLYTVAEATAVMHDDEAAWDVLRRAAANAVYAEHAKQGLSHFIFSDGSVLVSHRWGETLLTVEPADGTSWQQYHFFMKEWDALPDMISAMDTKRWMAVCGDERCATSTTDNMPCRPSLTLVPSAR